MFSRDISQTEAVGLLRGMLEIPSPSRHEAALGRYLARSMRALGFAVEVDAAGNVIGEIGSAQRPTVMLLSHMDTIPGDLIVRAADGRLYGRGAANAKGPLAAMISAATGAAEFPGKIVVIGIVESQAAYPRGALAIRDTRQFPDALIVGEPNGWSNIVLGRIASQDDAVARALGAGITRHHGQPVVTLQTTASDMNTLAKAWPVPMAAYGPGHRAPSQTYTEYITLTDYLQGIAVLRTALAEFKENYFTNWKQLNEFLRSQ